MVYNGLADGRIGYERFVPEFRRGKNLASDGLLDGEIGNIALLGSNEPLRWKRSADGLTIQLPKTIPDQGVIGCSGLWENADRIHHL